MGRDRKEKRSKREGKSRERERNTGHAVLCVVMEQYKS